jgi:hypothetical protein
MVLQKELPEMMLPLHAPFKLRNKVGCEMGTLRTHLVFCQIVDALMASGLLCGAARQEATALQRLLMVNAPFLRGCLRYKAAIRLKGLEWGIWHESGAACRSRA